MLSSVLTVLKLLFLNPALITSVLAALEEYGPLIKHLMGYIELWEEEKERQKVVHELTQGFQVAKETGDTSLLEKSIHDHCSGPGGCRL